MALTGPTTLTTGEDGLDEASKTTSSVSPTANALLVLFVTAREEGANGSELSVTPSDTFTGTGAWTTIAEEVNPDTTPRDFFAGAYWAIAGSSPGSGTVTMTPNHAEFRDVGWALVEYSGHDAGTPIAQSAVNTSAASTLTCTLGASPAADSHVLGVAISRGDNNGMTPGAGFTEIVDQVLDSAHGMQAQYDATSPGTSCGWSGMDAGDNAGVAFEVQAGGTGPVDEEDQIFFDEDDQRAFFVEQTN